jgi:S-adenosylmethionine synthetase
MAARVDTLFTTQVPLPRQSTEYVERKGKGHPDTICDLVMEAISVALAKTYFEQAGRVLHYNIDKGLLAAGQTRTQWGGGVVVKPMRLIIGDRATFSCAGKQIPIDEIVSGAAKQWFGEHLRCVDADKHLVIQRELRPGAPELVGIYKGQRATANDTSVGVGFAPLSETEQLVLAAEQYLNSAAFKHEFPETGEDVKVMGVRHGRELNFTVAIAFIDRFIWKRETYLNRKAAVGEALTSFLRSRAQAVDVGEIVVNALDDQDQLYTTVLGTSAENGDSGQVGRGNRVNGLISLSRPMTLEAAAGKNPVSHVGKIYNLLAHQMADRIHRSSGAIEEVYVWLCSRIGQPLDQPWSVSIQLALTSDAILGDVQRKIDEIVEADLSNVYRLTDRLMRGEFSVC